MSRVLLGRPVLMVRTVQLVRQGHRARLDPLALPGLMALTVRLVPPDRLGHKDRKGRRAPMVRWVPLDRQGRKDLRVPMGHKAQQDLRGRPGPTA